MKSIFAFFLGLFSASGANASDLINETSMNFDLENVLPFLQDLDNKFKFDLDVKQLGEFSASIPVESERSVIVEISDAGRKTKMKFFVFMSDIDAPDISMFFDSPELTESVGDFMMSWTEERGM